jgi:hypothetical protein
MRAVRYRGREVGFVLKSGGAFEAWLWAGRDRKYLGRFHTLRAGEQAVVVAAFARIANPRRPARARPAKAKPRRARRKNAKPGSGLSEPPSKGYGAKLPSEIRRMKAAKTANPGGPRVGTAVRLHVRHPSQPNRDVPGVWTVIAREPGNRFIVRNARGVRMNVHASKLLAVNPAPPASQRELQLAAAQYEDFHWGRKPTRAIRATVPRPRGALWEVGEMPAIPYTTKKGNEGRVTYEHTFAEHGGKKPIVASDGRDLFIVRRGARFSIRREGITG